MCEFNLLLTGACYTLAFYNDSKRVLLFGRLVHGMSHAFPCVVFISVAYRTLDINVKM